MLNVWHLRLKNLHLNFSNNFWNLNLGSLDTTVRHFQHAQHLEEKTECLLRGTFCVWLTQTKRAPTSLIQGCKL
jgi:hypothetical protein